MKQNQNIKRFAMGGIITKKPINQIVKIPERLSLFDKIQEMQVIKQKPKYFQK